jgi:Osmosensitive K+ channel histidine kinase
MNIELLVDDNHALFSRDDMNYTVFASDYQQIRYYTLLLIQHSRPKSDERLLLEQQVSEIIKNAVKHGNGSDPAKQVKVWYRFTATEARLIVEDEGPGFQEIEKWNLFNKKRQQYIDREDFVGLMNYVSWKTKKSDKYDGGNAMFAALEYWNQGVVYSGKRNTVAVGKKFRSDPMEMEGDE